MSLLGRLFGGGNKIDDPVFGRLEYDGDAWRGRMTWPHSPVPFAVSVAREGDAPSERARASFVALRERYPSLATELRGALFDAWAEAASGEPFGDNAPMNSLTLWPRLDLQGLFVLAAGTIELYYGFRDEGDPEGHFTIRVAGRAVESLGYEP
jgi:hypothetical protein